MVRQGSPGWVERLNQVFLLNAKQLLDFAFFIHNVLTDEWIKFLDFHFFRHRFLVFGGGVEVACAFAGNKFDFIAHVNLLKL
jgi:hypothetical protein